MPRYDRILFGAPWFALIGLILIPVLWPVGGWIETQFFPVVRNVYAEKIEVVNEGIMVSVTFDKVRECQLVDVVWYSGPVRIGVDRDPNKPPYPNVRTEGTHHAGPWLLRGVTSLQGTRAAAIHECHPLWNTVSHFYP